MTWFRDDSERGARGDDANREAFIGYILAANVEPASVALNPSAFLGGETGTEPLPGYGSPHPQDVSLKLDSYSAVSDGATVRITGNYSNNLRFTFPSDGGLPRQGFVWQCSTSQDVYSLPYAMSVRDIVSLQPPPTSGGPPAPNYVDKWVYLTENVLSKAIRVQMQFRVETARVGTALSTIFDLTNTAMPIQGAIWLCEGGDVRYDGEHYTAEVSFSREKGITVNYDQLPETTFWPYLGLNIPGVSPGSGRWARPPMHKTIIVPPKDGDPSVKPSFVAVFPYDYDPNGYQQIAALIP